MAKQKLGRKPRLERTDTAPKQTLPRNREWRHPLGEMDAATGGAGLGDNPHAAMIEF